MAEPSEACDLTMMETDEGSLMNLENIVIIIYLASGRVNNLLNDKNKAFFRAQLWSDSKSIL